jgi:inhibitor of growth protein 4
LITPYSGLCADVDNLKADESSLSNNRSDSNSNSKRLKKRGHDSESTASETTRKSEPRRRLAEAIIDRKSRIAVGAYDLIDRCIRLVDEELNAIDEALATTARHSTGDTSTSSSAAASSAALKEGSAANISDPTAADNDAKRVSNEPVYCLCRRVAFGEMIACDNEDCLIEWFHFPCVGLTKHPKKLWFCRDCSKKMKAAASSFQ